MSEIIGALVHVGYGQEVERGTPVAPSRWLGKYEFSFLPRADKVLNESSYGHISQNSGIATLRRFGEGSITAKIFDEAIGDFLKMVAGQDPETTPSDGVYVHDFLINNTNMHPSYTIAVKEGDVADNRYPGAILSSLSLDIAVDDYAKMTAEFISEKGVAASNTPTYKQEREFVPKHASLKVIAKGGDLDTAPATADVRSASIQFTKNALRKETLGNDGISPRNGRMSVTGEVELYYNATTFRTYWENDTPLALRLEVVNDEITIGGASHPGFVVDLPFSQIENWEGDYGNDDMILQTLTIQGLYDANNGDFVKLSVTNQIASYASPSDGGSS